MATFIRRKFAKMMRKDDTPPSLVVSRPEGPITFTKKELQRYSWLFTALDSDADNEIAGAEGSLFLRRSDLSQEQLRDVWRLASGGVSKPKLTKEDWLVACKLVALCQFKGVEPNMSGIAGEGSSLPLADFHYDTMADVPVEELAEVPPTAISVSVGNPTVHGSGLAKHTRYNVTTSNTLAHFPRKQMAVWRRYSDFEWLHKRLSVTFPAAIIPIFPEKRLVGNTDDSFVATRMTALESYLSKVVLHPALTNSFDLLVFLDATYEGLEAARSFIEAVAADDAESLLAKAGDAITSLASRDAAAPLVIKTDEAFLAACSSHGHALARLSQVVKAGTLLSTSQYDSATCMSTLGKALIALAQHERTHASAGASASAQVAAAALSSQRAQAALLGSPSTGTSAVPAASASNSDSAAAQAFAQHSSALQQDTSSIESMFKADFHDPYSALHAAAPKKVEEKASAAVYSGGYAEYLPDLLAVLGEQMQASATLFTGHVSHLDTLLLEKFRAERDKEAELGEAIKRRDAAIERVQDANTTVQRKRKALASLKAGTPDYAAKNAEAQSAVEKAEKNLAARRDELEKMTEVLKVEMARVNKARRMNAVRLLAEYAQMQAVQAKQRTDAWNAIIPAVSNDPSAVDASHARVAAIARKAEAKARAAAALKTSTAVAADGTAVSAETSASMPVFGEDAPMPKAEDL